MVKKIVFCCLLSLLLVVRAYSWNALGHRLVAQIAYHHLTKQAKERLNHYNHALDREYRPQNLVNAAVWLDSLHNQDQRWLAPKHYINLPFSQDGTRLIPPNKVNVISAIEETVVVLNSAQTSEFAKGFSLRILLHVVADIHQPMHAVSQFSARFPEGDKGGNLFYLGVNAVASTLHAYWDRGGGLLNKKKHYSQTQLNRKAYSLERRRSCRMITMNLDPKTWAAESHQLAIDNAYQIKAGQKPDKDYQRMVNLISEERLVLAGCRLAALLNQLK